MCGRSHHHCGDVDVITKIRYFQPWYFSHSAFERYTIIEVHRNWNWNCVAMKENVESVHGLSTVWHHLVFCWLIDSIRLSSNQHILQHKCIENLHLARNPDCIVFIGRSATCQCKREKVLNSDEVYQHERSNKNRIRGGNISYFKGVVVFLRVVEVIGVD